MIDPRFHALGHGGAVLAAQVLPFVAKCWENVGKMCGKDMEHIWKMSKCAFGLGIYDEIFMEINMWQWLMGIFHGKYILGFHGIFLWDHHGDDRGLIINNGKTYITLSNPQITHDYKTPCSSYCIHLYHVGCYIMWFYPFRLSGNRIPPNLIVNC